MQPVKYFWAMRAMFYSTYWGKFGKKSYIGKPTFIEGCRHIYIGERTRIFPGIRLQALGDGSIEIGDNVAIGQYAHIVAMDQKLSIGSDCAISQYSIILNVDHVISDIEHSVMDSGHVVKETKIGDGCFIGHGAVICAGTVLGKHCIVGANAVVKGHYPDYCILAGVPAKVIKRYNKETQKWERDSD